LNAANEVAVEAFLEDRISFLDISRINSETMDRAEFTPSLSIDACVLADKEAREIAKTLI